MKEIPTNQEYLTPLALEKEFGISLATQAAKRSKKLIPYMKIGNFIYYKRDEIYKWLENHSVMTIQTIQGIY